MKKSNAFSIFKTCFCYYVLLFIKSPNAEQYSIEHSLHIEESIHNIHIITFLCMRLITVLLIILLLLTKSLRLSVCLIPLGSIVPLIVGGVCTYKSFLKQGNVNEKN